MFNHLAGISSDLSSRGNSLFNQLNYFHPVKREDNDTLPLGFLLQARPFPLVGRLG